MAITTQSRLSAGSTVLGLLIAGLSVVYLVEWRSSRTSGERIAGEVNRALTSFEKTLELLNTRWTGSFKSIREGQELVANNLVRLERHWPSATEDQSASDSDAPVALPKKAGNENLESLPPLPDGIRAEYLIKDLDLEEFFKDPKFNPSRKSPSRVEWMKARAEATFAKSTMEILDSQVRAEVTESMEVLRQRGTYVEYAPGENYQTFEGVLSAGEETEDGRTRLFYFFPEEFPGIYAKKDEKKKVAELAVRRLLSFVADG